MILVVVLARCLLACGRSYGVWTFKCIDVLEHGFCGSDVTLYLIRCIADLDGVIM